MSVKRIPGNGRQKLAMIKELSGMSADVGYFAGNKYEDGTPVAYVASIQEFGYPEGNIPPRSFARSTISEKQVEWNTTVAAMLKKMDNASNIMELLGGMVAGDMRAKIAAIQEPALAQSTIAGRKSRKNSSTKPLVDTRILLPTLTHQVNK